MLDKELPLSFEGNLRESPSDALFWTAIGYTLLIGFAFYRTAKDNTSLLQWSYHYFMNDWSSRKLWLVNGFTALCLGGGAFFFLIRNESLSGYFSPIWTLLALATCILLSQYVWHLLFGYVWGGFDQHQRSWNLRFTHLPGIWLLLPIWIWGELITVQSESFASLFAGSLSILAILYGIGLFRAFLITLNNANTPWYLTILYLCTLELSPIFWIQLFQSYES